MQKKKNNCDFYINLITDEISSEISSETKEWRKLKDKALVRIRYQEQGKWVLTGLMTVSDVRKILSMNNSSLFKIDHLAADSAETYA